MDEKKGGKERTLQSQPSPTEKSGIKISTHNESGRTGCSPDVAAPISLGQHRRERGMMGSAVPQHLDGYKPLGSRDYQGWGSEAG